MKARTVLTVVILATAFLPILNWYYLRLGNGSGEPFGLLALALAIGLAFQNRNSPSPRLAEISLVLYAIGLFFLPPLLRTIPALATVAFLTGMHRQAGQFGLLLLSLPMQASLDFFLGYPFRLITAEGAHLLVNLAGYPVERLGVQLSLKGVIVSVDPPCSGLQMLWATAFLTALLAALFRLDYPKTFFLSLIALVLCLLANIFRAAALFFPEAGMVSIPGFAHEGIGLIFFAFAGLALAGVARRFHHRNDFQTTTTKPISRRFVALACGVTLTTFLPARTTSPQAPQELLSLESYQGRPVEEASLSPREESFAQDFPGQLKIYRVGNDTLIIRRITRASRMLHPSYHCLTAEGFAINESRIEKDEEGRLLLSYQATRNGERFHVTERIRNLTDEQQWTEVSAWYWHALFNPGSGPWEAETLMTPLPEHHE
jgi:exosortase